MSAFDVITIRDAARADGVTDDAPAFKAAIVAAQAAGGATISVDVGTYKLGSNITVPSTVTLWVQSGVTFTGSGSILTSGTGYVMDMRGGITAPLANGTHILDGSGAPSNSIGNNGDLYIDKAATAATSLYQKSSGTWGLLPTSGGSPSGAAGGSLAGNYPNPTLAAGVATGAVLGTDVIKTTTSAGGSLTGTYPNPTLASGVATGAALGADVIKNTTSAGGNLTGTYPNPTLAAGAATGAALGSDVAKLVAGVVPVANLGSGSPSSSNFLRGDGSWAVPGATSSGFSTLTSDASPVPSSGVTSTGITGSTGPSDRNTIVLWEKVYVGSSVYFRPLYQ